MSRPTPIVYLFHGTDEFTLDEQVREFRQRLGPPETTDLNLTRLDGRTVTLGELGHACQTIPFLNDRRLIVVTGLLTRLGKGDSAFLDGLLELLPTLPETTRLVLVEQETLPQRHPALKFIQEHERGYVRLFEPPKLDALPKWIIQRVQMHDGQIEPRAAAQMAQVIGQDLRLLDQEIIKLVTFTGPERPVTVEDVAQLVPYVQQAVIFDFVDALGQRDGGRSASMLQRLLDGGASPMYILAMIIRQFRLLIQVKELGQKGENPSSIARILSLHPFPTRKLCNQAINFALDQLETVYRHLLETDLAIKGGELMPEVALDLLVEGLTGRV